MMDDGDTLSVEASGKDGCSKYSETSSILPNARLPRTSHYAVAPFEDDQTHTAVHTDDFEESVTHRSHTQNHYSDDFEVPSTQRSHTQHRYSDDFEAPSTQRSHTQYRYYDDFEAPSTQRSLTQNHFSDDFEVSLTQRSHTQNRYSDDFEAPSIQRSHTQNRYSDDFEAPSIQRSDTQNRYSDDLEAPSTQRSNTQNRYSDDFEGPLTERSQPQNRYCDDFKAPSTQLGQTSTRYSDDFEVVSSQQSHALNCSCDDFKTLSHQRGQISSRYSDNSEASPSLRSPVPRPRTRTSSLQHSGKTTSYSTQRTSSDDNTCDDGDSSASVSDVTRSFSYRTDVELNEKTNSTSSGPSKRNIPQGNTLSEEALGARANFIEQKLQMLKNPRQKQRAKTAELSHKPPASVGDKPTENQPCSDFCHKKIALLKQRKVYEEESRSKITYASRLYKGLHGSTPVASCGISERQINWLRLKNLMQKVKQAATEETHEPRKCPSCRDKMAALAQRQFILAKTAQITEKTIARKMDEHCHRYTDTIGLVADIFAGAPTLRDDPADITERLMKPLQAVPASNRTCASTLCPTQLSHLADDALQFWDFYLSPLQSCSWIPKRPSSANRHL